MKLKASQIPAVRARLLAAQNNRCKLCHQPLTAKDAVLDHCHLHGHIRGVLHRWCNSTLGRVENWAHRSGQGREAFTERCARYLQQHAIPQYTELHPTFKSDDEKAQAVRDKAKKRRAAAKKEKTV